MSDTYREYINFCESNYRHHPHLLTFEDWRQRKEAQERSIFPERFEIFPTTQGGADK